MPGAVGKSGRFAWKRRGARYDHVERRTRGKRREEVRAHGCDAVPEAVCARVLGRRQYRVRVYVNGRDASGAGPSRSESENSRPRAHIQDSLTAEIEPPDIGCEEFARDEVARVKDRRSYNQAKSFRPSHPRGAPFQDEIIRKKVDRAAQQPPPGPVRSAPAVKAICDFDQFDDVVHCLPTLSGQTRMTPRVVNVASEISVGAMRRVLVAAMR